MMAAAPPRTVYIVDDDPRILAATGDLLEDCGHAVVTFVDGREMLARLSAGERPDLLLSDIIMPHINGPDLKDAARAIVPDLPILFMSAEIGDTDPQRLEGHLLLEKPFTCTALTDAVDGLMGSPI